MLKSQAIGTFSNKMLSSIFGGGIIEMRRCNRVAFHIPFSYALYTFQAAFFLNVCSAMR
jgi:hypothetical protein